LACIGWINAKGGGDALGQGVKFVGELTHEIAERLARLFAVESCDDGVARIRHENCRAREIGTHPLSRGEGKPS
jgi:hypothetical protein